MPKIVCPRNPDCFVDCDGQGYAFYEEPYGPCLTGCGSSGAARAFGRILSRGSGDLRISGRVEDMAPRELVALARVADLIAPADARPHLDALRKLSDDDAPVSASWQNATLAEVLQTLADASSGQRTMTATD